MVEYFDFELELKLLKLICLKFYTKKDKIMKEKGLIIWLPVADLRLIARYCHFITYHSL